jgi:hypothetical protein
VAHSVQSQSLCSELFYVIKKIVASMLRVCVSLNKVQKADWDCHGSATVIKALGSSYHSAPSSLARVSMTLLCFIIQAGCWRTSHHTYLASRKME